MVDWDGYRLVLDPGYGTMPRLVTHCLDGAVDAVVITHEHHGHGIDLHGLFRTWFYRGAGEPQLSRYKIAPSSCGSIAASRACATTCVVTRAGPGFWRTRRWTHPACSRCSA
jgi:ribonuclease BN (tRNA processing enzyme)